MNVNKNKMQIVIDNYFKKECDVNTSIKSAFEKGFKIGIKKGFLLRNKEAQIIEHNVIITDMDGCEYKRSEYLCGSCKKKVLSGEDYCSHCGSKLNWNEYE